MNTLHIKLNKNNNDCFIHYLACTKVAATVSTSSSRKAKNKFDNLLVTSSEIFEQWCKHFEKISTLELDHPSLPVDQPTHGPDHPSLSKETGTDDAKDIPRNT